MDISSVIEQIFQYLLDHNYSKDCLLRHQYALNQLVLFAREEGGTQYSPALGEQFLIEMQKKFADHSNKYLESYQSAIFKANDVFYGRRIGSKHRKQIIRARSHFSGLLEGYENYLKHGTYSSQTINNYIKNISIFLNFLQKNGVLSLRNIRPQHIYDSFSVCTDKYNFKTALKNFLRYAHKEQMIELDYSPAVPSVRQHQGQPTVYSKQEVEKLLKSVNRSTANGKRTYAVFLIIARLGLRVSDVCNLRLENLNRGTHSIDLVQSKTQKPITLPLLPDVADAIDDYIQNVRPNCEDSRIFRFIKAPYQPMDRTTVNYLMKKHFALAKINTSGKHRGPRSLRSSLASALLGEGISYPAIQKILGHSTPDSTKYYTKIDIRQLRKCALQVPPPSGLFAKYLQRGDCQSGS